MIQKITETRAFRWEGPRLYRRFGSQKYRLDGRDWRAIGLSAAVLGLAAGLEVAIEMLQFIDLGWAAKYRIAIGSLGVLAVIMLNRLAANNEREVLL